jgi:protein-tyrosine kinase
MSRVFDAMRRAGQAPDVDSGVLHDSPDAPIATTVNGGSIATVAPSRFTGVLDKLTEVPFNPAPESHLIDLSRPMQTPSEEFRSLRTKLNYMQTVSPIHNVVVTSASPAEGKSFTTLNLALAESHLVENTVLCADFDLRRPTLHNLLQVERSPGVSDFLAGQAPLEQCIKKIGGTNLYFMPAGTPVKNPLELLNLREAKNLFDEFPSIFNWTFCDSPPLLFSADANLLSTYADGTIIVVRIGATTIDTITRAVQALSENNVLGVVANGARAGELYSKYTYYYSRKEE